jgi:hypothetical protein
MNNRIVESLQKIHVASHNSILNFKPPAKQLQFSGYQLCIESNLQQYCTQEI